MIVLLSAVFISSFLGSEHAYGTLRNKLSVGYSRTEIYISSFIACYLAVMIMYATVWILTFSLGSLLLTGFNYSADELLIRFWVSLLAITMLTALYVLIGTCFQSKSLGSVTAVISAFLILMIGVGTTIILAQPEYIPASLVDKTKVQRLEISTLDPNLVKNPDYITGTTRRNFQIANDLGPVSQILRSRDILEPKDVVIPLCETIVLSIAGLIIFRKRDLK
jgi:ABC-type transport system involved in multi-copper enzyme maturation permease subunit